MLSTWQWTLWWRGEGIMKKNLRMFVLVSSDGVTSCCQSNPSIPQEIFMADLSTYSGALLYVCEWGGHGVDSLFNRNISLRKRQWDHFLQCRSFEMTKVCLGTNRSLRTQKRVILVTVAVDILEILGLRLVWTSVLFFSICVFIQQPQYSSRTIQ